MVLGKGWKINYLGLSPEVFGRLLELVAVAREFISTVISNQFSRVLMSKKRKRILILKKKKKYQTRH